MQISADGSVVRVDGISESNHKNSFLHEEYHEENRRRKATGLDRGVDRSQKNHWSGQATSKAEKEKGKKGVGGIFAVLWWALVLFLIRFIARF